MNITSLSFFALVIITVLLYYSPFFKKAQSYVLILSSLYFYISNTANFYHLFIIIIIINIVIRYYIICESTRNKRQLVALGVILNLLILALFKYSKLIANTFFPQSDGIEYLLTMIPFPVGISFITFHCISHLVDSYRSEHTNISRSFKKNAVDTMLYISFFPKILAGPIERSNFFLPQIQPKKLRNIEWDKCFKNIVLGYFFKMVIADNLKNYTFWIAYPYFLERSSFDLITMVFGYSIQIFADFAGYSLIAIGIAGLFGYHIRTNFDFPYISQSFSEFWRRWHISLSTFLRDYLYIPLGGNRNGRFRTYLNLMIVMCLGGLWHGAAWSFAIWGTFHGLALSIERFLKNNISLPDFHFIRYIKIFTVFTFVTFAWLLFKLPDFSHVISYFDAIWNNMDLNSWTAIELYIILYSLPVIIHHTYVLFNYNKLINSATVQTLLYGILLFFIITNSGSSEEFIYFQF